MKSSRLVEISTDIDKSYTFNPESEQLGEFEQAVNSLLKDNNAFKSSHNEGCTIVMTQYETQDGIFRIFITQLTTVTSKRRWILRQTPPLLWWSIDVCRLRCAATTTMTGLSIP